MSGALLQISSGRGPVEVRAFVRLLGQHLAAVLGAPVSWTGDPEAPLSASLRVDEAAGQPWVGTHLLQAPLRGKGARRRWFVDVRLYREGEEPAPLDPVLSAARAGGPGGQNVNRRATAVRAVDRNSGLAVRASERRSQAQNRALALSRLQERRAERAAEAVAEAGAARRAAHDALVRGEAVCVWVLGVDGGLVRRG